MNDEAEELLLMFSRLGTTDHDTLIKQFQTIVSGCDPEVCKFFLEANSWTLQNAIASFFELQGDQAKRQQKIMNQRPSMAFLLEEKGNEFYPNARFSRLCRLSNNGPEQWPQGCMLEHNSGEQMGLPYLMVST
eukprot:TRINITY_DN1336_c0_g1_i1.p1 TRINITY_DN1336_c0_g1~~TRINITY_DN1336_c0_g1_i1.p1  ORF type:complete len:133 (-),score=8.54 TRINITY_DN1336_c0_g1_i1:56-454(-)